MNFRRFVHLDLVVKEMSIHRTYSLRSIDVSKLFRPSSTVGRRGRPVQQPPPPPPTEEEDQDLKPCALPEPTMRFYPPRCPYETYDDEGEMEFMLLGGKHNKVVATDQTGRAVLYDADQHAVRTLPSLAAFRSEAVSLTVGDDHLYVLGTVLGDDDGRCFECLEFDHDGDEDWHPRVLPPPPHMFKEPPRYSDYLPGVHSYAAVAVGGGGGGDSTRILVSNAGLGTYSFDTATEAWSKAGNWTLPFTGGAEYVPEHGLWFGVRDDAFCAVDLAAAAARSPPAVRNLWNDFAGPPAEWMVHPHPISRSRLVHLGSGRFCIARFFTTNHDAPVWPVTHAVLTAVEVERRRDADAADGGLRMVKHGTKLYTLLHDMIPWVL